MHVASLSRQIGALRNFNMDDEGLGGMLALGFMFSAFNGGSNYTPSGRVTDDKALAAISLHEMFEKKSKPKPE
jgi:hypothetical protein